MGQTCDLTGYKTRDIQAKETESLNNYRSETDLEVVKITLRWD